MSSEYDIHQESMIRYYDNMSAINISKNLVQHNGTKHIDICYQFICELGETNVISLKHVRSSMQFANILTKPLEVTVFESLHVGLGVCQFGS